MRPFLKEMKNKHIAIEVDPLKLSGKGEDTMQLVKEGQTKLRDQSQKAFDAVAASVVKFPASLKHVFFLSQHKVLERFPEMGYELVGGFFFLRFICPAFVSPKSFGLIESGTATFLPLFLFSFSLFRVSFSKICSRNLLDLTGDVHRTSVLVSKVLQNLANNVRFGEKEAFMMFMNPFLIANSDKMQNCLRELAQPQHKNSDAAASNGVKNISYVISEKDKTEALMTLTKFIYDHLHTITSELDSKNQVGFPTPPPPHRTHFEF